MTRRKPEYVYEVRETLRGEAIYYVVATSQKEAMEKVKSGDAGGMIDSGVDHMGTGTVKRLAPGDEADQWI